ncbi:MAG: hypothetical protein AAF604_01385 [Acidobacteriota bacterium]
MKMLLTCRLAGLLLAILWLVATPAGAQGPRDFLFWADIEPGVIVQGRLPTTGTLYWAQTEEAASGGGIYSAGTDGSGPATVVPSREKPHDLALDPVNGHLYWTEGISGGSSPTAAIRRADLDGSNLTDILTGQSGGIRGLDLDVAGGKLYWTDRANETISRADLDGSNPEIILSSLDQPHDLAIDAGNGWIYWTEGVGSDDDPNGKIRRADLDGSNPQDVFTNLQDSLRDLISTQVTYIFADSFENGDTSRWSTTVGLP